MKKYDIKYYEYIEPKTERHVVKAVTFYKGNAIYAFAKCNCQDTFDYEFGMRLAAKRLERKVKQKAAAHAKAYAKYCKQKLEAAKLEQHRLEQALIKAEFVYSKRVIELGDAEAALAKFLVEA